MAKISNIAYVNFENSTFILKKLSFFVNLINSVNYEIMFSLIKKRKLFFSKDPVNFVNYIYI